MQVAILILVAAALAEERALRIAQQRVAVAGQRGLAQIGARLAMQRRVHAGAVAGQVLVALDELLACDIGGRIGQRRRLALLQRQPARGRDLRRVACAGLAAQVQLDANPAGGTRITGIGPLAHQGQVRAQRLAPRRQRRGHRRRAKGQAARLVGAARRFPFGVGPGLDRARSNLRGHRGCLLCLLPPAPACKPQRARHQQAHDQIESAAWRHRASLRHRTGPSLTWARSLHLACAARGDRVAGRLPLTGTINGIDSLMRMITIISEPANGVVP